MATRSYLVILLAMMSVGSCRSEGTPAPDGSTKKKPATEVAKSARPPRMTAKERDDYLKNALSNEAGIQVSHLITFARDNPLCKGEEFGRVGPTPAMSVKCAAGPEDGYCMPVAHPTQPWEYPATVWDSESWATVGVPPTLRLRGQYHYVIQWGPNDDPYEPCSYTAQAFGDLDDDGVYSTFERFYPPRASDGEHTNIVNKLE